MRQCFALYELEDAETGPNQASPFSSLSTLLGDFLFPIPAYGGLVLRTFAFFPGFRLRSVSRVLSRTPQRASC